MEKVHFPDNIPFNFQPRLVELCPTCMTSMPPNMGSIMTETKTVAVGMWRRKSPVWRGAACMSTYA